MQCFAVLVNSLVSFAVAAVKLRVRRRSRTISNTHGARKRRNPLITPEHGEEREHLIAISYVSIKDNLLLLWK